jgi:hypothetical protein
MTSCVFIDEFAERREIAWIGKAMSYSVAISEECTWNLNSKIVKCLDWVCVVSADTKSVINFSTPYCALRPASHMHTLALSESCP